MTQFSAQVTQFGWFFVALAIFFAAGLFPSVARRIYLGSPAAIRRIAAPLLFCGLAVACFLGVAVEALVITTLLGIAQIWVSHAMRHKTKDVA